MRAAAREERRRPDGAKDVSLLPFGNEESKTVERASDVPFAETEKDGRNGRLVDRFEYAGGLRVDGTDHGARRDGRTRKHDGGCSDRLQLPLPPHRDHMDGD